LLHATDVAVLTSYCGAYFRWKKPQRKLALEGALIEVDGKKTG